MDKQFRILVCDDSKDDFFFFERAVQRARIDAQLFAVTSGAEAIEFLTGTGQFKDAHVPNLLVLDIKMPGMDGFDVLAWIRRHPVLRPLPVIMFSGSDDARDVDRAHREGANSYLAKPNDQQSYDNLLTAIGHFWLRGSLYPTCCGIKCAAAHAPSPSGSPLIPAK